MCPPRPRKAAPPLPLTSGAAAGDRASAAAAAAAQKARPKACSGDEREEARQMRVAAARPRARQRLRASARMCLSKQNLRSTADAGLCPPSGSRPMPPRGPCTPVARSINCLGPRNRGGGRGKSPPVDCRVPRRCPAVGGRRPQRSALRPAPAATLPLKHRARLPRRERRLAGAHFSQRQTRSLQPTVAPYSSQPTQARQACKSF